MPFARMSFIIQQSKNKYSYLHVVVQVGALDIVEKLLKNGTDINIKDKFGKNPLMIAISAYKGDRTSIDYLTKNRANIETKANFGVSCIQLEKMKEINLIEKNIQK